MSLKKKPAKAPASAKQRHPVCDAAYYGVIGCATLVGLVSYSAGASLEGVLVRVAVTLLACTAVGYLVNVVVWLAAQEQPPAAAGAEQAVRPGSVNFTVGDERAAA